MTVTGSPRRIAYRSGYRYVLAADYTVLTPIRGENCALPDFALLTEDGWLTIRQGYAWDGASSIAIDTATFMRASLIHDCLYGLLREGGLPLSWRPVIDDFMGQIAREDGMWALRAQWAVWGVRTFGEPCAKTPKPIQVAP